MSSELYRLPSNLVTFPPYFQNQKNVSLASSPSENIADTVDTRVHAPDSKATTHRLLIKDVFDQLPDSDKLYAHHLLKAAWTGSRIILRQTSSESERIFDLIMSVYHHCDGN
jgi:hypothetical protein